jgi:CRP/FNR family transcriptional regulator, cyclic AMP receptor protein
VSWLLDSLSEQDRARVHAAATRKHFARNQVLYHEGDPADSLHIISKGHVAISVAGVRGESTIVNVLGVGDVHGELALLSPDERRSASAIALDACDTLCLHRSEFERLCAEHRGIERLLARALARRVRELSDLVREALYVGADVRVMRRLAHLAAMYGDQSGGPVVIPISQDALASMAGTARPTANRVLRALHNDGVLILTRGRITVADIAALTHRSRLPHERANGQRDSVQKSQVERSQEQRSQVERSQKR